MPLRVFALLLAILMAAGIVSPTVASAEVASLVDDGAVQDVPAVAGSSVVFAPPARRELRPIVAPVAELHGRLYKVWVFRPPPRVSSR